MLRRLLHTLETRPTLPLWMAYPPIFAVVYVSHFLLLRLPYYWDEGGYYIPAAWDFYRFGTVIPVSTVRNAHPPLPAVLLAGWWKMTGFSVNSTRLFICIVAAFALLAVFCIGRALANDAVALAATVLTGIYPVWFAQSTLAHADIFAAAFTLWALALYFSPRVERTRIRWLCLLFFSLSVLSKETAIITPAALTCFELGSAWISRRDRAALRTHLLNALFLAATVLPLVAWYGYHHAATGFTFGNPEYLRYNATANLGAKRILLSLWHRATHLVFHMNLWVVALCTLAVLWLQPMHTREGTRTALTKRNTLAIVTLVLVNWIAFSVLGGALLTRYLLPVYPLLFIACVALWRQRFAQWWVIAAIAFAGFAVACRVNPNYPYAPEDNLAYRDMIVLHQHAIGYVTGHYPEATVLTAWPVGADLLRPELGYVKKAVRIVPLENFSKPEIVKASAERDRFDTAIVFSTKYMPPNMERDSAEHSMRDDAKYFDFHDDLLPDEIATLLHGEVVWHEQRQGEWAAVLRFPRGADALLRR